MPKVHIIGVDLAKRVFQVHGAYADGSIAFRRKLSRTQFAKLIADHPKCIFAMEACATAHHWGRQVLEYGHEARLVPPNYVKPFVKRHKNDAADSEAIVEAASRPSMRFVDVKTQDQQAKSMLFRTRELYVRQRTQLINAFRGHLGEHGIALPQGPRNVSTLREWLEGHADALPAAIVHLANGLLGKLRF